MDNDYRISEFAPLLAKNNPKKVKEVVRFLEDEMGIPEEFELKDITIEDLTKNGLLKHGPARLLVNGWQGKRHLQDVASFQGGGNQQHIAKRSKITGVVVQQVNDSNVGGENAQLGGTRNYFTVYTNRDTKAGETSQADSESHQTSNNPAPQLWRIYKERLKTNALAICGEADAFRGGKIREAELQIVVSSPSVEDRGGLPEGSHHRENLIQFYYSKKQRDNISYKELFEVLQQRVEEIQYKGETTQAQQVFVRRHSGMAVIVGEPGIGKSSLAKRIVREMWEEEDPLFNSDVVFFIRFRYVDFEKDIDLLQFLDPNVEATYPKRGDRIKILEKLEKLDNVYVVMDGLDEANIELKSNTSKFSSIHFEKKAADFIEDLWNGNILPKSRKLVTSRPYAISKQPKVLFTIQGLTETGLERICSDICDNEERCKIILNYLENHLDLKSYCFTPVICIMTMKSLNKSNFVFELSNVEASGENATRPSNRESMTAIFVGALKDWLYEEKDGRKFKLRKLSLFAFDNFKKNKYFFRDYELKEAKIDAQNISNFFFKGGEILYFVHLMWQEFLVAVHFRLYTKQLEPNDSEKLSKKSYEMVSRFLFGLCNEQTLGMLLDCVEIEEGRNYADDREKFKQELKQLAMTKLHGQHTQDQSFHSFLPTLKWVREMGDPLFITEAIKETAACMGNEIELGGSSHPILPTDVLDIIKVLNVRDAELALVVEYPSFVGNSCELFFEKLLKTFQKKCNIHLEKLNVGDNSIDDALLRFILSNRCVDKVEELAVVGCKVSNEIVEKLAEKIEKRTKKMEVLGLSRNPDISDVGAAKLLGCLGNLHLLWLENCSVSDEMGTKLKKRGEEVGCIVDVIAPKL